MRYMQLQNKIYARLTGDVATPLQAELESPASQEERRGKKGKEAMPIVTVTDAEQVQEEEGEQEDVVTGKEVTGD